MKFTPKLPDEHVNHPKERFLLQALKLVVALAVIVGAVYGVLLFGVDYTISHLTPRQEQRLMKLVRVDFDMQQAKKSEYLQRVTDKLATCAKLPYDIRTYILDVDMINAFALPGGTIMITRGMLVRLQNENELASVIGHEIGHFKHKDHLRGLGKSLVAGVISMLVAENYGPLFGTTLQVANAKYSQSQELDADLYGIDLLACAYGNAVGATGLFERMDKGEKWKYFLASHPDFGKRVATMRAYIRKKGYKSDGEPITLEPIVFKR